MKQLLLLTLLLVSSVQKAQVNLDEYKTIFFQEVTYENEDYKMYLVKSFARTDVVKLKMRIFNKTNDLLIIKPNEFVFNINNKTFNGYCKPFIIQPNGEDARFVDVTDFNTNLKCESFEVTLNGFYKVSTLGDVYVTANAELPSKKDVEISAGPIKCNLSDIKLAKEKSFARYQCEYTGDKIAVIDPSKCVAVMPNGQENRCTIKKDVIYLDKENPKTITIEFKKLNGAGDLTDGFAVKWNETFRNSELKSLKAIKVPMKIDITTSEK